MSALEAASSLGHSWPLLSTVDAREDCGMIRYRRGGRWQFVNLFVMRGSVFPRSCMVALPAALVAALLKYYDVIEECNTDCEEDSAVSLDASPWSAFTFLVGFLIVFRTRIAYKRFWEGCTATHKMRAEWIEAASTICAFCAHSSASKEVVMRFKQLVVRLFSVLHLMSLALVEDSDDLDEVFCHSLELIDPSGIDTKSWNALKLCHHKPQLVFTWLEAVLVENIKTGVLTIPPPIASRVFQEIAAGMVQLQEAQKITYVPFPFPYAQTCDLLLFMHWLACPAVTVQYATGILQSLAFSFIQVFFVWSLNNIAIELEVPFGSDANDLDPADMQRTMNDHLLLLLSPAAMATPELSDKAKLAELECLQPSKRSVRRGYGGYGASYNEARVSRASRAKGLRESDQMIQVLSSEGFGEKEDEDEELEWKAGGLDSEGFARASVAPAEGELLDNSPRRGLAWEVSVVQNQI